VSIVACFQSRAQLVDRYGDAKAATIINNSGARVLFGGTADRDDLNYWSTMAGDRDERIGTVDARGATVSRTVRSVPVLAPSQLATLPAARVVVFTNNMAPVVGKAEQAWRRGDVHAFHHPDALTVRTRAWTAHHRAAAARWVGARTRPARAWAGAQTATVGRWCTALRVRVTGHGAHRTDYMAPHVVPGEVIEADTGPAGQHSGGEVIPFPTPGTRPAPQHTEDQQQEQDARDRADDGSPW